MEGFKKCSNCNFAIGHLKHDPILTAGATKYLLTKK